MEIKTIGDLRKLLSANGGTITIGKIEITYLVGQDIDIHFDGSLIQYYNSSESDESNLIEEGTFNYMDSPTQVREKEGNNRAKLRKAEERIEELEKLTDTNTLAIGKVAAYEKILEGRDLTIPQY